MKLLTKFLNVKLFSKKTFFEVLTGVFINVTSAWFTIIFVSPGFFGVSSIKGYYELLTGYLPYGIVGLFLSALLAEKTKSL